MKLKQLIELAEDILLVAREQDKLINPNGLLNKTGGDNFVSFHLKTLIDGLKEVDSSNDYSKPD